MNQAENVSAAEFVRHFAEYREAAQNRPVIVTNHGRQTHVLLSVEEYQSLTRPQSHTAGDPAEAPLSTIKRFADWITEGMLIMDQDLRIASVNRQFELMVRMSESDMIGRDVDELHANIPGSVSESLVNRTLTTGQSSVGEFPSFFRPGRWIHMQSFPWDEYIVALFRDITDEVTTFRLADVKQAILGAMECHGRVGVAQLSTRGTIDRCGGVLSSRLGLDDERLTGVPFADVVDLKSRVKFREALEKCLRSNRGEKFATSLLGNSGDLMRAEVGMHGLHGAYGVEGVIVVLTFLED